MPTKLLIVDDETDLGELLKDYFQMKGFVVFGTGSGEEAIALLRQEKPEVIVLDMLLKGKLNGIDVLKDAKQNSPQSKVIMLTGSDTVALENEAKRIGVSRYLHKPVTVKQLEEVINEVLSE
jgi:two-component system response regulator VicR